MAEAPYRIDTHTHLFPPQYVAEHGPAIANGAPGYPSDVMLGWTPERSLAAMEKHAIAAMIVSVSPPAVWGKDPQKSRALSRHCNDYGARLVADHRDRFGMFATLPLPDTKASLEEIAHALDTLKLDGIGLLTSYDGKWPGDPAFAPVFDELNRRKAVVYFHPTATEACENLLPNVPPPILEYVFDTTRAITSLLYNGTLARCPDIRFIFSHGGGTLPYLADRIASLARRPWEEKLRALNPKGVEYELKKLYYDAVSIAGNPPGFAAFRGYVPASQILFGTDFPYLDPSRTIDGLASLTLPATERRAVDRDNALRLFPRFAAAR
jgi:6-methylsalicylate decarboxylase